MTDVPQAVTDGIRAEVDEWAAQSRLLLAVDDATRYAAEQVAAAIAALGHPGAGRPLADAQRVVLTFAGALERVTGQELGAEEVLALLGMAGLVLADRESDCG